MLETIDALREHGLPHAPTTHPQRRSPMRVTLQLVSGGRGQEARRQSAAGHDQRS
jgi:hypothetical protein